MPIHTDWPHDPDGLDSAVRVNAKAPAQIYAKRAAEKDEARQEAEAAEAGRDSARERLREAEDRLARSAYGKLLAARDKARADLENAEAAHRDAIKRHSSIPDDGPGWHR